MKWWHMKWLSDIIRDKDTGHVVARDLFKAAAFGAALLYALVLAYREGWCGVDMDTEPLYALLAYSGGLQYIKARQNAAAGIAPTGSAEPPPPSDGLPHLPYQLP